MKNIKHGKVLKSFCHDFSNNNWKVLFFIKRIVAFIKQKLIRSIFPISFLILKSNFIFFHQFLWEKDWRNIEIDVSLIFLLISLFSHFSLKLRFTLSFLSIQLFTIFLPSFNFSFLSLSNIVFLSSFLRLSFCHRHFYRNTYHSEMTKTVVKGILIEIFMGLFFLRRCFIWEKQ